MTFPSSGKRWTSAETIALAKQLDVPVINMHLSTGVYFTLPDRKVELFSVYREQYLKSMAGFRTLCEESVGDALLKICVENCGGFPDRQKEALDMLLESPFFGLTFDVGIITAAGAWTGRISPGISKASAICTCTTPRERSIICPSAGAN